MFWYYMQNLGMGDYNPIPPIIQTLAARFKAKADRHKITFRYAQNGVVAAVTNIPSPQTPPPISIPAANIPQGGTQRSQPKTRTITVQAAQPTAQIMQAIAPLPPAPITGQTQTQTPKPRTRRTMKYVTSNGATAVVPAVTRT